MRFLVDAQLPSALARYLASLGHQAEHVSDVGMLDADDSPIWDYAVACGAIVLTKDEDFPHRLSQAPLKAPVVVWLRVGNASRRALLEWFGPLLPNIVLLIENGEKLIEVR
ncbi:Predicted nuclease, contains PIN domain, potential toxin-antitoxin system component [Rubritalea squalenifaciens DSM 18772]|uniref:Predicted nuclease, contains PIN domain, potential toxin-antitoxin system component n=1 Tax=Rubritalea squalenifaciens DSM 18772 TaxID=1123071 RepID=A0A1M6KUA7_9BACT|nr:DUF5615 family PIN-like protein [Rubritalea squalenifaciens]SHJ62526.1 Predicted nuclease, contains PIN domain, potential toxin-antitoxin system component [Rubritalea squalenifaciens DSM 18772]